ncbi:MAG: hypothetical protein QW117_00140 [Candidatus Pacearchaeota archaeon]
MKKNFVRLSLVLLLLIAFFIKLNFIKAQNELPSDYPLSEEDMQRIEQFPDTIKNKWEYLQKEWKNILLKNKLINATDNFMQKPIPDTTFRIFFGVNWNVEYFFTIIGIIILWIIIFFTMVNLLKAIPLLGEENKNFIRFLPYIGSLLFSILIAQLNFYYNIIVWLGKLIFKNENKFIRFLYLFLIIIICITIITLSDIIYKYSKKRKKEEEEEENKNKIEKHEQFIEGIKEGKGLIS